MTMTEYMTYIATFLIYCQMLPLKIPQKNSLIRNNDNTRGHIYSHWNLPQYINNILTVNISNKKTTYKKKYIILLSNGTSWFRKVKRLRIIFYHYFLSVKLLAKRSSTVWYSNVCVWKKGVGLAGVYI